MHEVHRRRDAGPVGQAQFHKASGLQIGLHHRRRHAAPTDAGQQQRVLGTKVADPPRLVGEDPKSRPAVSVDRSVSTSCTWHRAAPIVAPDTKGCVGAATGMSSRFRKGTYCRRSDSMRSGPQTPSAAVPSRTCWLTAPSDSILRRIGTVGNACWKSRSTATRSPVGSITSTTSDTSASRPSRSPFLQLVQSAARTASATGAHARHRVQPSRCITPFWRPSDHH